MNAHDAASKSVLNERGKTKALYIHRLNLSVRELWWLKNGGLTQEETLQIRHVRLGYQSRGYGGVFEWPLTVVFSNKDLQHSRNGWLRSAGDDWVDLPDGTIFESFLIETLFSEIYFDDSFEEWRVIPNF